MLKRIGSVIYGIEQSSGWIIYEIDPVVFEDNSVDSQSSGHNKNYRLVTRSQIRELGEKIYPVSTNNE